MNQAITFSNSDTAAKYELLADKDQTVHIPAGTQRGTGWKGKISTIPPAAADKYVKQGGNLIREKKAAATPAKAAITTGASQEPKKEN